MVDTTKKEWFGEWFDSPYYPILYKHRDKTEAAFFIDNLESYLGFKKGERALDLACGNGRHSLYLHSKGLQVTGLDLAKRNISQLQSLDIEGLSFYRHDMRKSLDLPAQDYVFNLFTSFGYFDTDEEDISVLRQVCRWLKPDGTLVLDFLNPQPVLDKLVKVESKNIKGIDFAISRHFSDGFIIKEIRIKDGADDHFFQEKVKAITLADFQYYMNQAGLQIVEVFGDYELNAFEPGNSGRMIFIAKKAIS
ncbi:MAG: class I SAM-dependent methyltransferase [Cyclobacteriaceae bacterium]|nr:class I SAM-dependent methyltransferase [Cyclobacteriaceae bacterium]MCH8515074.1 class I SAM-dependent methyltransferase [Cyclobacteriaceae bacterium]